MTYEELKKAYEKAAKKCSELEFEKGLHKKSLYGDSIKYMF